MFVPELSGAEVGEVLIAKRPSGVLALFLVMTIGPAHESKVLARELKVLAGDPGTAARMRGLTRGSRTPEEAERRLALSGLGLDAAAP